MTNLVKCMLPKNRKPTSDEIEVCSQFMDEEILIIQPKIIVPLGYFATRTILTKYNADPIAAGRSFTEINGELLSIEGQNIFPMHHPAALLYNPSFEAGTIVKYKSIKALSNLKNPFKG